MSEPLVSVITPVYNGERYLAECIESVLRQSYGNWEYIINNNGSTDRTLEIAESYARQDSRIRVFSNETFVRAVPNHNIALGRIDPQSKYVKVVNADDWLFPECLSRMVAIAEANPTVGVVGAFRLEDRHVTCHGLLPYTASVVPGREMGRMCLKEFDIFGSMSTVMFRADLVRRSEKFYNEARLYADTEACYTVLREADFGFVHQVLTYSRVHEGQLSSFAVYHNVYPLARLSVTKSFGPDFLDPDEYASYLRKARNAYYVAQGNNLLRARGRSFWRYHQNALAEIGLPFSWWRLVGGAMAVIGRTLGRPFEIIARRSRLLVSEPVKQRTA